MCRCAHISLCVYMLASTHIYYYLYECACVSDMHLQDTHAGARRALGVSSVFPTNADTRSHHLLVWHMSYASCNVFEWLPMSSDAFVYVCMYGSRHCTFLSTTFCPVSIHEMRSSTEAYLQRRERIRSTNNYAYCSHRPRRLQPS